MTHPSWKLFVLGRDKSPLANCDSCRDAGPEHDRETCPCLVCHGFYAATDDPNRIADMKRLFPENAWAVRTGAASGIIVLDAEGRGDPTGVEVLDAWEQWTGFELPSTRQRATTPSGGVHLYYEYAEGVRSRNRVLPGVDLKSDGGYVVVPWAYYLENDEAFGTVISPEPGRRWLELAANLYALPTPTGPFLEWLRTARGRGGGSVGPHGRPLGGYDYERFLAEGCPGGMRDEFFNELIFRTRKAGITRQDATVTVRRHWEQADQPPDAEWYMPWHHVEYKIERIWRTVEPDRVEEAMLRWAAQLALQNDESVRVGRVTLT